MNRGLFLWGLVVGSVTLTVGSGGEKWQNFPVIHQVSHVPSGRRAKALERGHISDHNERHTLVNQVETSENGCFLVS